MDYERNVYETINDRFKNFKEDLEKQLERHYEETMEKYFLAKR